MTASSALVADCLVNLFAGAGAILLARQARSSDPRGPVTTRIVFALRFVAILFFIRVVAWIWQPAIIETVAVLMASATPLVSLVVAEGLLRRHAPKPLKIALAAAPWLVTALALLPWTRQSVADTALMLTVTFGFLAIAVLLWRRRPEDLSASENATVAGILFALLVLAPLVATDFRSLWPAIPVRLGALATLILLYVGLGSGNLHATLLSRTANVGAFVACAGVLAIGAAACGLAWSTAQVVQIIAVGTSAILFSVLWVKSRPQPGQGTRALASLLGATTPAAFDRLVASHPLLGGAHVLSGAALDQIRHPEFASLFAGHPTLRLSAAPWGRPATDDGVERALSLMTAYQATHLGLVTPEPLRLIAFSLPPTASDAQTESLLEIARLVGEVAYLKGARS